MYTLTRRKARLLRAAVRRCARKGGPRAPDPVLSLASHLKCSFAFVVLPDVTIGFRASAMPAADGRPVSVPLNWLAGVEGADDTPVTLEVVSAAEAKAAWTDRGEPKSAAVSLRKPAADMPALPVRWEPAERLLTAALHEAGRCAAVETGKYNLTRLQLRGKDGRVVGTDGKQALIMGGFRFPFAEDVHVPAVPVFGMKEWDREFGCRIGRTGDGVCVGIGEWLFWLKDDKDTRFPDVAGVIRRHAGGARLHVNDDDAAMLLANLPKMPGADDDYAPVTVCVGGACRVRARAEAGGQAVELRLTGSSGDGPPTFWTCDRRYLHRALLLGFRDFTARKPGESLLATGGPNSYVFAQLEPEAMVGSPGGGHSDPTDAAVSAPSKPALSRAQRNTDVNPPDTNSRPDPAGDEPPDPLAEAEALRAMLGEALTRSARLVTALKGYRRQRKAIESAWSSLQQLKLGQGG